MVRHQLVNDEPLGRSVDEAVRMLDALQFFEKNGKAGDAWHPESCETGKRVFYPFSWRGFLRVAGFGSIYVSPNADQRFLVFIFSLTGFLRQFFEPQPYPRMELFWFFLEIRELSRCSGDALFFPP